MNEGPTRVLMRWWIPSQPSRFVEKEGLLSAGKLYEELPSGDVVEVLPYVLGFAGWVEIDDGGQGTKKGEFD